MERRSVQTNDVISDSKIRGFKKLKKNKVNQIWQKLNINPYKDPLKEPHKSMYMLFMFIAEFKTNISDTNSVKEFRSKALLAIF
jgi:hypothetical protein